MARILAVDDSAAMRLMLGRVLRSAGHEVEVAGDAGEALRRLAQGTFQAVITDVNMPGITGLEFIRRVRAAASGKDVPILVLTTDRERQGVEAGREAGATGWMVKPFDTGELLEALREVLA